MCKGILLTFFYLVLTIQSKVIDQSLDRGPVLGVLWLLFNPATSIVEAPDRRHYNRARPVAESNLQIPKRRLSPRQVEAHDDNV